MFSNSGNFSLIINILFVVYLIECVLVSTFNIFLTKIFVVYTYLLNFFMTFFLYFEVDRNTELLY